jgi:hypothetical protein
MEDPKVSPEDIDTLDGVLDDIDPNEPDERTKRAENVIVTLKKQAGVKTVKELLQVVAPKAEPKVETKPPVEVKKEESAPAGVTPAQLERVNLRLDGYSESEVDFIMRNGGASAKNDEFVQSAIEARRAKEKSEKASPPSSSKSPVFKKHTEDDLKKIPLADLEKLVKELPPSN